MKGKEFSVSVGLSLLLSVTSLTADSYRGGGYEVTIEGWGASATYIGCNSRKECVKIGPASWSEKGAYTWERNGYTYTMSPYGGKGKYRLRVFDPRGKKIVEAILSPVPEK
jgi:hypothetical protein